MPNLFPGIITTSLMTQSSSTITVKRLPHATGLPVPCRMTPGSSGCDIAAAVDADIAILPGKRALIPTGFCFEIPEGFEVQVRSRSGLAAKYGVFVLNSPGTIDADYRGEVKVILANLGDEPFTVRRGDRIAQVVPMQLPAHLAFTENDSISETKRGAGGFGHTGVGFDSAQPPAR
jgi:dUTP pyrophosphatase